MMAELRWVALAAVALLLGACVYYEPVPVTVAPAMTAQQRFDRSWAAAAGAMSDQGLTITAQDRGAGVIRGDRGGVTVTATLTTLPDGAIGVKFSSPGTGDDLARRVWDSYERRMGR